jgi:hypothetical protein
MYHKNPRSTTGDSYRVLDYFWANFGWGLDANGRNVHHPEEMWLYTCQGDKEEWHKETPLKVVFAKNVRRDGTLPQNYMSIVPWVTNRGRAFLPLSHPDFESYEGPLPIEVAKQKDLRTLSKFLTQYLSQDEIDALYPEPEDEHFSDSDGEESEDSDDD